MSAADKILKQVEFYFGDSNLPGDKFLKAETAKDEGWVEIAKIASFARMKQLSTDLDVVVEALKKSESLLEVSEDGKKVRRSTPLPGAQDKTPVSVYMKGFPTDSTLDSINEVVEKLLNEGEKRLCTRMRRLRDKTFKTSVFLEFDSEATAKRVSELKVKIEGKEEPLMNMLKADYITMKKKERGDKQTEKKGKGGGKKRKADGEEKQEEEKEVGPPEFKTDLVIKMAVEKKGEVEVSWEELKAAVTESGGKVGFVDYNRGQTEGFLRLAEDSELKASAVVPKLTESKTTISENAITWTALSGEAETAFWVDFAKQRANRNKKGKGKRQKR